MEKQVAEGDMVVTLWTAYGTHHGEAMGVFPFGKQNETSMIIMDRISGGKITENWANWDVLEML